MLLCFVVLLQCVQARCSSSGVSHETDLNAYIGLLFRATGAAAAAAAAAAAGAVREARGFSETASRVKSRTAEAPKCEQHCHHR